MSGELERRLRASLDAYSRLTDDVDLRPGIPSTPPPLRQRGRRWAPLLVAAAVLLVLGGVWGLAGRARRPDPQVGMPATTSVALSPATTPPAPATGTLAATVPGAPGHPGTPTLPPSPTVGVVYRFDLLTHCGVRGTDVGGVWFAARPVLAKEGVSAPDGWGNPYQPGTLTLLSGDSAVFRDDLGHVVDLVAAPREAPPPCD